MQFFNFSDCRLNVNNGWYLGGEGHFWPCVCEKARKEIYGCMKYQNQSVLDHYWETPHDVPMIL